MELQVAWPGDVAPVRAVFLDVYGTMVLSSAGAMAREEPREGVEDPVRLAVKGEGVEVGLEVSSLQMALLIEARHAEARRQGVDFPEVDICEVWREMTGGRLDDETLARLAVRCEIAANPCWPEPTLSATLAELKARGIPVGIVSNAQFYTCEMLEAFLGTSLEAAGINPALMFWSHKERRAKPSPTLYEAAVNRLEEVCGIPADQAAMVGNDLRNDVAPAIAVGMQGILYAGDMRSLRLHDEDPELAALRPSFTITSLEQLLLLVPDRSANRHA